MSITDKKGINVTSGFKLISGQPIDARFNVEDETELQSLIDNGAVYEGLHVWVKSLGKEKVWNGTEFTEIQASGGNTGSSEAIVDIDKLPQIPIILEGTPIPSETNTVVEKVYVNTINLMSDEEIKEKIIDLGEKTGNNFDSNGYIYVWYTLYYLSNSDYSISKYLIIGGYSVENGDEFNGYCISYDEENNETGEYITRVLWCDEAFYNGCITAGWEGMVMEGPGWNLQNIPEGFIKCGGPREFFISQSCQTNNTLNMSVDEFQKHVNDSFKDLFSVTPFEKQVELDENLIYRTPEKKYYNKNGNEYIEFATNKNPQAIQEVDKLPYVQEGTEIPTQGSLEKIYINKNITYNEGLSIFQSLNYTTIPGFGTLYVPIIDGANFSAFNGLVVLNSFNGSSYSLIHAKSSGEQIIILTVDTLSRDVYWEGGIYEIDFNVNNIMSMLAPQVGMTPQNEKLKNLISITPFENWENIDDKGIYKVKRDYQDRFYLLDIKNKSNIELHDFNGYVKRIPEMPSIGTLTNDISFSLKEWDFLKDPHTLVINLYDESIREIYTLKKERFIDSGSSGVIVFTLITPQNFTETGYYMPCYQLRIYLYDGNLSSTLSHEELNLSLSERISSATRDRVPTSGAVIDYVEDKLKSFNGGSSTTTQNYLTLQTQNLNTPITLTKEENDLIKNDKNLVIIVNYANVVSYYAYRLIEGTQTTDIYFTTIPSLTIQGKIDCYVLTVDTENKTANFEEKAVQIPLIDTVPTPNSENVITSGAVYEALQNIGTGAGKLVLDKNSKYITFAVHDAGTIITSSTALSLEKDSVYLCTCRNTGLARGMHASVIFFTSEVTTENGYPFFECTGRLYGGGKGVDFSITNLDSSNNTYMAYPILTVSEQLETGAGKFSRSIDFKFHKIGVLKIGG